MGFWLIEFGDVLLIVTESLVWVFLDQVWLDFSSREFDGCFVCESLVVDFGCASLVKVLVARVWCVLLEQVWCGVLIIEWV